MNDVSRMYRGVMDQLMMYLLSRSVLGKEFNKNNTKFPFTTAFLARIYPTSGD